MKERQDARSKILTVHRAQENRPLRRSARDREAVSDGYTCTGSKTVRTTTTSTQRHDHHGNEHRLMIRPHLVAHAAKERPVLARPGVVEPGRCPLVEHAVRKLRKPEQPLSPRVAGEAARALASALASTATALLGRRRWKLGRLRASREEVVALRAAGADPLTEPSSWPADGAVVTAREREVVPGKNAACSVTVDS